MVLAVKTPKPLETERCPRSGSLVHVTRRPCYPFEPRSTAYLERGQFWGVPLSDGHFACGRVLDVPGNDPLLATGSSKTFFAGLMDWVGLHPPTAETISGCQLLANGVAHILTVRANGRFILGRRDLAEDGIVGLRSVSHRLGGTPYVYEGARRYRPATRDEAATLPLISNWGYRVVARLAEHSFVTGRRLP